MFYRKKVQEAYQESILLNPTIESDLKDALKVNERTPQFIDNLALQMEGVAEVRRKKGKPNLTDKQIKDMVYDITMVFVAGLREAAKRRFESDMDRITREQAAQKQKDIEQTAAGNISGDYEEFGIVHMTEERSVLDGTTETQIRTQD